MKINGWPKGCGSNAWLASAGKELVDLVLKHE
jgi:hypothetical protein